MPSATNIVINDGATSPVAHTFVPIGKDAKGVLWFEQTIPAPANPQAAKRLSYRQTRGISPTGKVLTGKSRVEWVLWLPTMETLGTNDNGITPPPTVAYTEECRVVAEFPERGLKQERKDARVLLTNLLGHSLNVSAMDDLQPIYT